MHLAKGGATKGEEGFVAMDDFVLFGERKRGDSLGNGW
jgi:hypothetical protein